MLENMHRLHPRGAGNRGVCVDAQGAMLGPDCVLVRRTHAGFRALEYDAAIAVQKCAFGANADRDWLFRQCQRIADALNKGEIALAQIYGLRIPVGELDDGQSRRIGNGNFAKAGFDPDELRVPKGDPHGGEWTAGGGDSQSPGDASALDATILADLTSDPAVTAALPVNDANQTALWMVPTLSSVPDSAPDGQIGDEEGNNGAGEGDGLSPDDVVDIAYPGVYHNLVVRQVAELLRARGAMVITEVDLVAKNGASARADIIANLSPGTPPVIVEAKTGLDPQYTSGQQVIYPMAQVGDHVYSPNAKIEFLGFLPGQWLPPMVFITVYKRDTQSPFMWFKNPNPIIP